MFFQQKQYIFVITKIKNCAIMIEKKTTEKDLISRVIYFIYKLSFRSFHVSVIFEIIVAGKKRLHRM